MTKVGDIVVVLSVEDVFFDAFFLSAILSVCGICFYDLFIEKDSKHFFEIKQYWTSVFVDQKAQNFVEWLHVLH